MKLKKIIQNLLKPYYFDWKDEGNVEPLLKKMNSYAKKHPEFTKKYHSELEYLNHQSSKNNMHSYVFPNKFVEKYNEKEVVVFKDENNGLFYVIHEGKKLYFKSDYNTIELVQNVYNCSCVEQDPDSAHCYVDDNFKVEEGDILLDIGAAEGNFALANIEKVKKVYLFETEPQWIEALQCTFAPWKDKVEIINKYVSDNNNNNNITLESFFENKEVNFIKMDIEGEEINVINSSINFIKKQNNLKIAACTYHNNNDAKILSDLFNKNKIDFSFSKNNMLFIYDKLSPPFFRKGLIRASYSKKN